MDWVNRFSEQEKISFVVSVSADVESVPESVRKYVI